MSARADLAVRFLAWLLLGLGGAGVFVWWLASVWLTFTGRPLDLIVCAIFGALWSHLWVHVLFSDRHR